MHFGSPGWMEFVLIAGVIILLFGARRLPDLARALGKSLSEFKKGREEGEKDETQTPEKADDQNNNKA